MQEAEAIFAVMPAALLVFDGAGVLRDANLAAAALLDRPLEELVGLRFDEIVDAELEHLLGPSGTLRVERNLIPKHGARVPVLLSATRHGEDLLCIALDLRDRKRLEIELRQAQKLEAVGRLAAGIAHEINTPVQFVSDSLHFVRESIVDLVAAVHRAHAASAHPPDEDTDLAYVLENAPKAIDRALEGLERVTTLVRSLKEFAHPDHKEMTPVDLNRAIRSTITVARSELRYVADVDIELGELPTVMCHAGDLNQALLNIVVNAAHAIADVVKWTAQRGRITISSRQDGADAIIAIADTGGGIPEAVRERIFDPFFTTKEAGRGTGQGLAIARNVVVDKHGGQLTFETAPGVGTTFTIRLPIAPPARVNR